MNSKSSFKRRAQLAFGTAILASLIVAAISYRSMVASTESNQWVRHSREILENLQYLVAAIQGIESSYRGFMLTGEEFYLESYRAGILRTKQAVAIVGNLTADNAKQETLVPILERLTAQKVQFGERVISLRRTTGLTAAADAVRTGRGEEIMDEFQGVVRQMQDEELELLMLRDADVKQRLAQTKTILILGTVLSMVIAVAASWSVQRDNSQRGLAKEALRGLKSIPVVILTTSASEADIQGSYQHHANCYITKPVDLEGFLKVVTSIDRFCLSVVKLPQAARS